jgi:hypothetical protein
MAAKGKPKPSKKQKAKLKDLGPKKSQDVKGGFNPQPEPPGRRPSGF